MKCPFLPLIAVGIALLAGCSKPAPPPPPEAPPPLPPPTPESVVNRLTQPSTPAILPHKIEPATAFPQALASLSPGATPPKLLPQPVPSTAPKTPPPAPKPPLPPAAASASEPAAVAPAPPAPPPPAAPAATVAAATPGKTAPGSAPAETKSVPDINVPADPNRPPTTGLTADGITTDLVVHDWTGIVLVPLDTSISRAHTTLVALDRIEAHPLDNGQVRIWARIRNISGKDLPSQVACSFRTAEEPEPERPIFYTLKIPHSDYRDVFFVSPEGRNLNSYTVLVRSGDETTSATGVMP